MPAIHLVDHAGAARTGRTLTRAALAALAAPAVLDTHPWRWRIEDGWADLLADPSRVPSGADPDGRLLTISCGAALHHTTAALTAAGVGVEVIRLPAGPHRMARLHYTGEVGPNEHAQRLGRAIAVRGSDRRPIGREPVPEAQLRMLQHAAEAAGARLFPLAVNPAARRPRPEGWAVITTPDTGPHNWLATGEAISAVLLHAAAEGLVTAAITERSATVPPTLVRRLPRGAGHPAAAVRFGIAAR
ncbi:hypothetical protein ACQP00_22455 [Dactylosporangium sp. CS-047395]|uniref:hypothetical protein n=1 Tax=Dactylosporangium sp. CS-047395 TaxID=3239936 RepID=UPI003D8F248F